MNFGKALKAIRKDEVVARKGWNGKGQFIGLETPSSGDLIDFPYIYICTVKCVYMPWVASQTDILADDWEIV